MFEVGGVGGGVYIGRTTPKIGLLGLILHEITQFDVLGALRILVVIVCLMHTSFYYR